MRKLGIAAAFAAAAAWLLDPSSGRSRRARLRDRTAGFLRRALRRGARGGRHVVADARGLVQKAAHLRTKPGELDDVTLKNKVETEIFRQADAPKGQVSVNAQQGVVQLRGEVDTPALIDELVRRTRSVRGVRDVENLLHVPGTPAPMHQ